MVKVGVKGKPILIGLNANQAGASIALDPNSVSRPSQNIIVSSTDYTDTAAPQTQGAFSTNGGASWSTPGLLPILNLGDVANDYQQSSNSVVVAGSAVAYYVISEYLNETSYRTGIHVAPAGAVDPWTTTWDQTGAGVPVEANTFGVVTPSTDSTVLFSDPAMDALLLGNFDGTEDVLFATFTQSILGDLSYPRIFLSASFDSAGSWPMVGAPLQVNLASQNGAVGDSAIAFDQTNGLAHIVYKYYPPAYAGTKFSIWYVQARITDDTTVVLTADPVQISKLRRNLTFPSDFTSSVPEQQTLGSISIQAAQGHVYVAYAAKRKNKKHCHVWEIRSTDAGSTWKDERIVSTSIRGHRFKPRVAVDSGNDYVWVTYESSQHHPVRKGKKTKKWNIYARISKDSGKCFSQSERYTGKIESDAAPLVDGSATERVIGRQDGLAAIRDDCWSAFTNGGLYVQRFDKKK
jgi:hypothetical protein